MKSHISAISRICLLVYFAILTGCLSDGTISSHPFYVLVDRDGKTPTLDELFKEINTVALSRGFVQVPHLVDTGYNAKDAKVAYYTSGDGKIAQKICLSLSYRAGQPGVEVMLFGPEGRSVQQSIDQFYAEFTRQFAIKYDPRAISSTLRTSALYTR